MLTRSYDAKHPKGSKYSSSELKRHRDAWFERVSSSAGVLSDVESRRVDSEIFHKVCSLLPWTGSIGFVKSFNFAGFSFDDDRVKEFYLFLKECDNPAFEFIDADLEGLRIKLRDSCTEFVSYLAINTYPLQNRSNRQSVPNEWWYTDPERFEKAVSGIHERAKVVGESYDAIVRLGVRKLGEIPR